MDDWQFRAWVGPPSGGKLGAAFLVTGTRLLTCAHTVHGLEEARVGFPGLMEDLPARVVRRGGWRRAGDLGDVAVLELAAPVPLAPARLAAPGKARDLAAAGREFGVCGFPRRSDGDERHATVRTNPVWVRRREWWELRAVDGSLEKGYSGSAVYDMSTGEVIGMMSDAEFHGESRSDLGSMLPLDRIRVYWEELDDLLPLEWLTAPARRELRELLAGVPFTPALAAELEAVTGRLPLEEFQSAWHSVRHVAEGFQEEHLVRYLRAVRRLSPDPHARRLTTWSARHMPDVARPPGASRPEPPSVIVRLERLTHGDAFDITVHLWTDGAAGRSRRAEAVPKPRVQQVIEERVAELAPALFQREWMIEFAVPQKWLSTPFEQWYVDPGRTMRMRRYPVVVRDVRRLRPDSFERDQAYERWRLLNELGRSDPRRITCDTARDSGVFSDLLEANVDYCVLVYGARPPDESLRAALSNGVPVMLWPRTRCGAAAHDECHGHDVQESLAEAVKGAHPADLPRLARDLRKRALVARDEPHCGHDLTLLWDDPSRLPDPPLAMEV
ncbi:VMAP-C domain-containing protein [Actinomadura chokoriensis]|uniref:Trypsin-like peptidase domain-containing protein n=1 Tax=Actinomadura chokoriensis TaxID=454156 RepID=A0ABV4QSM5_9ACTN